jgi:hypothetical protein
MDRDGSESVPPWLSLASWTFWLAVTAVAIGMVMHTLAIHRADAAENVRNWQLRVDICERLSKSPRPPWWECHTRANRGGENLNLLAPSPPGGQPRD